MKHKSMSLRDVHSLTIFLACLSLIGFFSFSGSVLAADVGDKPLDLTTAIIGVAKQAIPAVVHIEVTERQEISNPLLPFKNDPFFQYFFGKPNMPKKFERDVMALGTGMIIDAQGHILTNYHVVGGATKIQVVLSDGRQYSEKSIKIIGTDPKTDLAVIQITTNEPLPFLKFGNSDKIDVGTWVVAIGHPRGLDQTVTQGIISAKHRRGISDPNSYQDFLQTDAAINPGNSGGPLLNLDGEVIGVNAAIMSESGGFEGIGFAIPVNMADFIVKQLISHGKVDRGWLGISIQDLTPELAKSFGITNVKGALVADVARGGPASAAGMKRGDLIIAYQGKEVTSSAELRNEVATAPIGQDITLTIIRDGKQQDVSIKVGSQEEQAKALGGTLRDKLGVDLRPLTSKETSRFNLESNQGLVISSVDPRGPLGKAGLEKGDIILQVNNQPVDGLESFASIIGNMHPREKFALLVVDHRTGKTGLIRATLP